MFFEHRLTRWDGFSRHCCQHSQTSRAFLHNPHEPYDVKLNVATSVDLEVHRYWHQSISPQGFLRCISFTIVHFEQDMLVINYSTNDYFKLIKSACRCHFVNVKVSLIPHLHFIRLECATLEQTYCEFSMANSIVISCTQFDRI